MNRIVFTITSIVVVLGVAVTLWMTLAYRLPSDLAPMQTATPATESPDDLTPIQPASAADGDVRWIAFEDLNFKESAVRDRLEKLHAAAQTIATPQWQHVPWHWQGAAGGNPPTHFIFATQWCSRPSGKPYCSCSRASYPCHKIELTAIPHDMKAGEPKEIYRWSLLAQDYPADEGWGVRLHYSEGWFNGAQHQETLMVDLHQTRWSPDDRAGPALRLPCDSYTLRHKFGDVEYLFTASLEKLSPEFHQARAYLSSPAALGETIVGAQDALETLLDDRIEADTPTLVMDHALLTSAPPTSNPPEWGPPRPTEFQPPIPAKYALTAEQKQELRDLLATKLAQRRQLARTQSHEIHAAIERAFPLGRLLKEFDAKSPTH